MELVGANPDIAMQNDQLALSVLERMRKLDLPEQVYARLIEFLPAGELQPGEGGQITGDERERISERN